MAYGDYRECSSCKKAITGYGFVAALKGLDPKKCPSCGELALEKKPCPKEVEDELDRRFNKKRPDGPKALKAGDDCVRCLVKGTISKLVAMHGSKKIPGVVKALSQLVCPGCGDSHSDPDDPVLLEASRKADE